MTLDAFLLLLKGVQRTTNGFIARCPAHDDSQPSLSVSLGDKGQILINCFADCASEAVVHALDLEMKDLYPTRSANEALATYDYRSENGTLLFQVLRYVGKSFKQRRPNDNGGWTWNLKGVRRVLYRLCELLSADTSLTVFVVEGEKDTDRLREAGAIATCSPGGAGKWRSEYADALKGRNVIVIPDNDQPGIDHARQVALSLTGVAESVVVLGPLPDVPPKGDVSDYLAAGHTVDELLTLARQHTRAVAKTEAHEPVALLEALSRVRRWLGAAYDTDAFLLMLATVAAERLDGDPLWTMFITGSGFTKTETVTAAEGAGAIVTSTIASEGALLSGSSKRDVVKGAHGGLMKRIGQRGVLVIKDVTTILSMNREARAAVLAALREIYDGKWERNIGSNGGVNLRWEGRIAVIGACTTAWDAAHAVISSMGDRFVIFRLDSTKGRLEAGRQSLANIGHEVEMRAELQRITAGVIAGMNAEAITLTNDEVERILAAANLVTRCRTSVETDFHGEVVNAHAPEAPTRFAKQLAQIVRGACAIGVSRNEAMDLAIRCARDSMPPLRLEVLCAMASLGESRTVDIRAAIDKPWNTVKRQLDAMHLLGVLRQEVEEPKEPSGKNVFWYALAEGVHPEALGIPLPGKSPTQGDQKDQDFGGGATQPRSLDNPGNAARGKDLPF